MLKKISLLSLILLNGTISAEENFLKKISECYQSLPKKVKTSLTLAKHIGLTSGLVGATCLGIHYTFDNARLLDLEFNKKSWNRDFGTIWGTGFCTTFMGLATLLGITLSGASLYEYVMQLKAIAQNQEVK